MDDKLLANILAYWKHADQSRDETSCCCDSRHKGGASRARCELSSAVARAEFQRLMNSASQQRGRGAASISGVVNQSRGSWQTRRAWGKHEARGRGGGVKALLFCLCEISCVNPNTRTHLTQPPKRATASLGFARLQWQEINQKAKVM